MVKSPSNLAASIRQRLLNLARKEGRVFDAVLVAYALERLIYRLSISSYHDQFVLKGGMLVTLWTKDPGRYTRDVDFLAFGEDVEETLKATFANIMALEGDDGLLFDSTEIISSNIRENQVYGGKRLRTTAYLGKTRIPITIDLGFGDALSNPGFKIKYESLLALDSAMIRAYSPATVIAEKFQSLVVLGFANSRMKDFYDLWAIPNCVHINIEELCSSIERTFARRETDIPTQRPDGLTPQFTIAPAKVAQWTAYAESTELENTSLYEVSETIWTYLAPVCQLLHSDSE